MARARRRFVGMVRSASRLLNQCVLETLEQRQLLANAPRLVESSFDYDTRQALIFKFDDAVSSSITTADFTVKNLKTNTTISTSAMSVSFSGTNNTVATLTFPTLGSPTLPDGDYMVTLNSSGITGNTSGLALAGNNVFEFWFLNADFNRDRIVNALDFNAISTNYGGTGKKFSEGDANYDGTVNSTDFTYLSNNFNVTFVDLDIDSNNTSTGAPERGTDEEAIEDDASKPGKIVTTDNGDIDADGIPDFADGFNADGTASNADDSAANLRFVPLVLTLPSTVDVTQASIKLIYDASDPASLTGNTTNGFTPASGTVRLWTKDGFAPRKSASVTTRSLSDTTNGYFVPGSTSGVTYSSSDLEKLGLTASNRSITLYVEAVRPGRFLADARIRVEIAPDSNPANGVQVNSVRLTTLGATPPHYSDPMADAPGGVADGADGSDPSAMSYSGAVRYADGTITFTSSDIDPSESEIISGYTRTWTNQPGHTLDALNGNGWQASEWPALIQATNSIVAVDGGRMERWFDYDGSAYKARFFGKETLAVNGTGFILTDSLGNKTYYHGFGSTIASAQRGKIDKYIDAGGNETSFTYSSGQLQKIERKRLSDSAVLEDLTYSYDSSGRIQTLQMRRLISGSLTAVRDIAYDYYTDYSENGRLGDLKRVTVKVGGTSTATEHKYYRYDQNGNLHFVLEGASYERLANDLSIDPANATDSQLQTYANNVFTYYAPDDANVLLRGRVQTQTIQGEGTYSYTYAAPPSTQTERTGINVWKIKTTETLPDSTQNLVYSNYAGEVVLNAFQEGANVWRDFYQYDSAGRMTLHALPSAVTNSYETSAQILDDPSSPGGTLEGLADSAGLIEVMAYSTSTTATPSTGGDALGYLKTTGRAHGENAIASPILQQSFTYLQRPVTTNYVVKTVTMFRDDAAAQAVTTSYDYTFYTSPSRDRIQTLVTHLPVVSSAQNGPGTDDTETTVFDTFGRPVWEKDADGYLNFTKYEDSLGAVVSSIIDADPSLITTPFTSPGRGGSLPTPLHLDTESTFDGLGRPLSITDPRNHATTYQYFDDAAVKRIITLPPVTPAGSANDVPTGSVVRHNRSNGTIDVFEVKRDNSTGALTSTITKLSENHFNTQQQMDSSERYAETSNLSYNTSTGALTGLGNGSDTRYRIEYGYDSRGRQNRVVAGRDIYTGGSLSSFSPTITRTVYDGLSRQTEIWIGTNDTGWAPTTGGTNTNMTMVSQNQFDNGGVGDSNLTQVTQFPNDSSPNRVTQNYFDWRDRMVASKAGIQGSEATDINRPITYCKYDNLDRCIIQYTYDGDSVSVAITNGVPDQPLASLMRSALLTQFDDRGRVFRKSVFSVNQTSGVSGAVATNTADQFATLSASTIASLSGLRTEMFYDRRDNLIKEQAPGGLVTKMQYDGASRTTKQFTSDGGGDASWADAANVTGDSVLEQVEMTYDKSSNVVLTTTRQRHHDDSGTGDLASASASVSFVGNWYDEADRLLTTVNFGNNGNDTTSNATNGSTIDVTQPPPARDNANGWNTLLRTDYGYQVGPYSNVYGSGETVTDPRGIVTETRLDSLDRKVEMWEARQGTALAPTPGVDSNRGTLYEYNGFDEMTQEQSRIFIGTGARNYVIQYMYGVTKGGDIHINNSGLLNTIHYGTTTGGVGTVSDDEVATGYNALGEVTHKTMRNSTTHLYTYSVLGQMLSDEWTNPSVWPTNRISTWATKLTYNFDTLGRGIKFVTLNSSSILNQVDRTYDGLGNLTAEQTTINEGSYFMGPSVTVVGTVSYVYDTNFTSDFSRLNKTVYPNSRVVWTGYGTGGGLNDRISRVEVIADGTSSTQGSTLESYKYLGLSTVVKRNYDAFRGAGSSTTSRMSVSQISGDTWTADGANDRSTATLGEYVDDAGTNDPYNGLDRFGRVIEQYWGQGGNTTGVERVFAYDEDGNTLFSLNPKGGSIERWRNELYQSNGVSASTAYDNLNRMTHWARGIISASAGRFDFITPDQNPRSQDYGVTTSSGNFDRTTIDPEERHVFQASVPASNITFPPTSNGEPRRDTFVRFDAFGRLAGHDTDRLIEDLGGSGDWNYTGSPDERDYEYDALGRRILERTKGSGSNEQFSLYLFNDVNGNVLEVQRRQLSSSTVNTYEQYVLSDAGPNLIVLRDRETDGLTNSNDYGFPNSGLDERLWVEQGPDGSVWEVWPQNGINQNKESYLYTPEGSFDIVWGVDNAIHDHSQYDWRYFYQGGRAEAYPFVSGSATFLGYDGLQWMPATKTELDTVRGSPLGEDIYAYHDTTSALPAHQQWNYQESMFPAAGSTGAWTKPGGYYDIGRQIYNPHSDVHTLPTWVSWTSRVTGVLGGLALAPFIGPAAAIEGVAGSLVGGAVGSLIGGGISYARGGTFNQGAGIGFDVGAFAGSFPKVIQGGANLVRFAGAKAIQYSDEGARGAINLARWLSGSEPPFATQIIGGGLRAATMGGESALAATAGMLSNSSINWGSFANAVFSLSRNPQIQDLLESGAVREVNDYRAGVLSRSQIHHIATKEDAIFSRLFRRMFRGAGMDLEHFLNKIPVIGHQGPHGIPYNLAIFRRLSAALNGLQPGTTLYRWTLRSQLKLLASEITEHGSDLNLLVRFPG